MTEFYKQVTLYDVESSDNGILPPFIGEYKIESLLDKGGMSVLYLGLHPTTREPLTIKVLSKQFVGQKEAVQRFLKEAEIIELTNHPNIVKIHGHGRWEGGLYIAMEFIQGISLREMVLQQAMSLRRALEIVLQISQALLHLHSHGIIHRDLKPENILLTAAGGIKVIDFGIAALYTEEEKKGEKKKRFMGTPAYMSPELQSDPSSVSFASDIYALGIITYELVLGRLSYGSVHLSFMPKGLQKILSQALNPQVDKRYQDVVDFMTDISSYLSSEAWKKEMRGTDYLGELNEGLKEAQGVLVPRRPPQWVGVETGLASNSDTAIAAVYFDFFQKPNGDFSVVLAESIATGVEGLLSIALLRGMVRALIPMLEDPSELTKKLNEAILNEGRELNYSFAFLQLSATKEMLSYISCGYLPLWYLRHGAQIPSRLSSDNGPLGVASLGEVIKVESNWQVGDSVVLHTFQAGLSPSILEMESDEKEFLEALEENIYLAPQQQVDAIFRRVALKEKALFEKPLTIITLARSA